jgi:hypothetical protein
MALTNFESDGLAASARRAEYETVPSDRPCTSCGTPKPLHALNRIRQGTSYLYLCAGCHEAWLSRQERTAVRAEGPLDAVGCRNCGRAGSPLAYERCHTCYVYWRRHGYDREVSR